MGYKATIRAMEAAPTAAAARRTKRQRELERQNRSKPKLSAIEQARLEVKPTKINWNSFVRSQERGEKLGLGGTRGFVASTVSARHSNHELKTKTANVGFNFAAKGSRD